MVPSFNINGSRQCFSWWNKIILEMVLLVLGYIISAMNLYQSFLEL